jgi:L-methionine (R)-S-oxide reductase
MLQGVDAEMLVAQARALIDGERDPVANSGNLSALLFMSLGELNWAGVYVRRGENLVLGPFQGKPATARIAMGAGVCGRAAAERRTLVVPDVHVFPGHIACDVDSRSEIVVPLIDGDDVLGVLDLDSPIEDRFHADDRRLLEEFARLLVAGSDFQRS